MLCSIVAFTVLVNSRLRRLVVRRMLEEAGYHSLCRWSHAHCRRWRRGHAPGTQTEPQLEAVTSMGVTLPETGQFLLLCSLQLWQQLQRCRQLVQECKFFYAFYFRSTETVRRERYMIRFLGKRTITSECLR